jgi:hypothetical protein
MAADRSQPGDADGDSAPRVEMDASPPFLTWRAIYALVLAALAAEIVAGVVLSALLS